MLDFTCGDKVQLELIFLEVFFTIQLFERFLAILSSCSYPVFIQWFSENLACFQISVIDHLLL